MNTLRRTIIFYLVALFVLLSVPNILYPPRLSKPEPSSVGSPRGKLEYYKKHLKDFNLVFIGDSRTYCAMDSAAIDKLLATKSINLSSWAHWFGTQYPQIKELVPLIPKDTTIIWSIGHQNFHDIHSEVNSKYPIKLSLVPDYLSAGFSWAEIKSNVIDTALSKSALGYLPGASIFSQAKHKRYKLESWLNSDLNKVPTKKLKEQKYSISHKQRNEKHAVALAELYRTKPDTQHVQFKRESGLITSLEVIKRRGSYVRVEIEKDFFREKQKEQALNEASEVDPRKLPDKKYWSLFKKILKEFKDNKIKLIVNEIEEAPFVYQTDVRKAQFDKFMEQVKSEVSSQGIPYIKIDFTKLKTDDYFDYNHLNQKGINKYLPLLSSELKPLLGGADGI